MNAEFRMKINIAICDDEPLIAARLREMCEEILGEEFDLKIETALSGRELLQKDIPFQIALLDVQLPEQDGISLARELMTRNESCRIIFVSGLLDAVSEVYEVPHFCFVLKEQLEHQLPRFLKRAAELTAEESGQHISVLCGRYVEDVALSELVGLERRGHNTFLTLADGTRIQCKEKLNDLLLRIGGGRFVRCHISYAVNLAYVEREEDNGFRMKTGQWVPISRPHQQQCRESLWWYLSTQA